MNSELLLGIDIGTQGVKGALVTPKGVVVASSSLEHGCDFPRPDWCEHDITRNWWRNPVKVIQALLGMEGVCPEQVKAIGISGLFPAMGPTDENGVPLYGAILYSDNRAIAEVEEINNVLDLSLTSEELTPKLLWFMRNEPELAVRMRMFFDAPHYLVYRLCGAYLTDSILPGLYGAIFDPVTASWREEVCERLGIPVEILPHVHPVVHIAGEVHAEAVRETGLAPGTPVLTGAPDIVASLIGAGTVRTCESVAYYGSAGLVPVMKQDLIQAVRHPLRESGNDKTSLDSYLIDLPAYSLSVGDGVRWFRDQFAPVEMMVEHQGGQNAYARLHELAGLVPPTSGGLVMLPYLQGQRTPDFNPWATGVFFGLNKSHKREALLRAMLESFGFSIRHGLETCYPQGHPLKRLVATGGGARSVLWRQIVSDITGIPQEYMPNADEVLGNAYLAGMALGWYDDFDTLQNEWIKVEGVTEPNTEAQAIYGRAYTIYVELHTALKPLFRRFSQD